MPIYRAMSLQDIANHFDNMAERNRVLGNASSGRQARELNAESRTWKEASRILRDTIIEGVEQ